MCGRIVCSLAPDIIQRTFQTSGDWQQKENYAPSYNVGPSRFLPCITYNSSNHSRSICSMRWGFDSFLDKITINARADSIKRKKMFSDLFQFNRCVIIANG